jgi:polyhydroxyalkanoate synthesis regulator phasin
MNQSFQIQAATPLELQTYLRDFVQRLTNSKLRIEMLIEQYRKNHDNLREQNIDENELMQSMIDKYGDADHPQIVQVAKRFEANKEHLDFLERKIAELESKHVDTIDDLQAHLKELADIEMSIGNFIAHIFALRDNVKVDKNDPSVLHFGENGSVEIAIATSRQSWNDSSQLTLIKKEG